MASPIQFVAQWIMDNKKIQYAPGSNGGWERWAQVDFSLDLTHHGIETFLEDRCFKDSNMRDDVTILGKAVLEFKTFNLYSETVDDYCNKIYSDQTKLEQFPLSDKDKGLTRWAIGIAGLKGIVEQMGGEYPRDADKYLKIFEDRNPHFEHELINLPDNVKFVISYKQVVN